jgi:HTH-type transcriptional regulator, sugar sensing transcriptional regulator
MQEIQALMRIGLSEDEAQVYLTCLSLGISSISDIAKKAGVKRPTVYNIMDELLRRGVVSKTPKGKRMFYTVVSPGVLLQELQKREAEFERLLPRLEAMRERASGKPRVQFFEGKEGIRRVYRDLFTTHRTLIGIASLADVHTCFSRSENAAFFNLLRREGGQMRDLVDDSPEGRRYAKEEYRQGLGPVKFLPKDFTIETDMLISGTRALFVSYSTLIAALVDDERIALTQRKLIEFLWKNV